MATIRENLSSAERNRILLESRRQSAKEWMKRTKDNFSKRSKTRISILNDPDRRTEERLTIGSMYLMTYDAKTKEKLPWWDYHPLILPFSYADNGFYGLNIHYIPPRLRADILDVILKFNKKGDLSRPTANMINRLSKLDFMQPAIKRYLYSHIVGFPAKIDISEWEYTIYLPLADWRSVTQKKPHANKIYADYAKRV